MKIDKNVSFVRICPENGLPLSYDEMMYSHGVCPRCGHNSHSTVTHSKKIIGRWVRPTIWEWIFSKRKYFSPLEKSHEER